MRASLSTMLLSVVAVLWWTDLPAAWGQSAGPPSYQVSGNLAADVSAGQPQAAAQEPCASSLGDLFDGILRPRLLPSLLGLRRRGHRLAAFHDAKPDVIYRPERR